MAGRKKSRKKTTALAPRRAAHRPARAMTRTRTRTVQVVRKVADRAKNEVLREKEMLTAVALSGILGFINGKMDKSKLPKIIQTLGLPTFVGLLAFILKRMNLGGAQMENWLFAASAAGLSIGAYNLGGQMAIKTTDSKPALKGWNDDSDISGNNSMMDDIE